MHTEIRIIIADNHPVFRHGLRQVMEAEPDLHILGEAQDGLAALDAIRCHKPQVAVLDVDMPRMDGLAVVRALREERLNTRVVFLTMHKDEDLFNEALNLDVQGYVVKDSAVTEIAGSVRAAAAGQVFISPSVSAYLFNRSRRAAALVAQNPSTASLTATERRIMAAIAEHKTSKEIARDLFISHRTVENHRSNICQKLDLHGAHALLRFALDTKSELS
jgi:DNA-binding NarL/FixJ family response regulator